MKKTTTFNVFECPIQKLQIGFPFPVSLFLIWTKHENKYIKLCVENIPISTNKKLEY